MHLYREIFYLGIYWKNILFYKEVFFNCLHYIGLQSYWKYKCLFNDYWMQFPRSWTIFYGDIIFTLYTLVYQKNVFNPNSYHGGFSV